MKVSMTKGGVLFVLLALLGAAAMAALNARDIQRYLRIRSM